MFLAKLEQHPLLHTEGSVDGLLSLHYNVYQVFILVTTPSSPLLLWWISSKLCECIAICSCWSLLKSCYDFIYFHDFQMNNKKLLKTLLACSCKKPNRIRTRSVVLRMRNIWLWRWDKLIPPLRLVIFRQAREKRMRPRPIWNLVTSHLAEHSRSCQKNVMVYAHGLKVFWEFTNHSNL